MSSDLNAWTYSFMLSSAKSDSNDEEDDDEEEEEEKDEDEELWTFGDDDATADLARALFFHPIQKHTHTHTQTHIHR